MRNFLNAIKDFHHAEERSAGASRSTHNGDACNFLTTSQAGVQGPLLWIPVFAGMTITLLQFDDNLAPALTTTLPTMRGWIEQKYSYSPGAVKVCEKVSSVSRAADLNFPSFSRTVCGVSSALVQVTVVPGATTSVGGVKLKLSMRMTAGLAAAAASPAGRASGNAPTSAIPSPSAASRAVICR